MHAKILEVAEKFHALSLRERVIVAATTFFVIGFIWLQLVFVPYEEKRDEQDLLMDQYNGELAELSGQMQALEQKLSVNPNDEHLQRQERLNAELTELKRQFSEELSELLSPEQVVVMLREVLSSYSGLTLLKASNLPVARVQLDQTAPEQDQQKNESEEPKAPEQAPLYAHSFEMTFSGSYFQTLEFIQKLESLEGFYWNAVRYEVTKYPKANITIRVSTLSLDKDWIGV